MNPTLLKALHDAEEEVAQGRTGKELTQRERGSIFRARQTILMKSMEQRLGVPFKQGVSYAWTRFKRPPRSWEAGLLPPWFDHTYMWGDKDLRFLTTEPYLLAPATDDDARAFSERYGYDGWFRLPPELGFWNPPRCHVIAFYKSREGYSTDPNVIMA